MRKRAWALLCLAVIGLAAACSSPAEKAAPTITVFAAASLGDAFRALAGAYQERSGVAVELTLAGSQQLAFQIREGAPADVFASANSIQMDEVVASGRVDPASVRDFAANRLVVAAAAEPDNPISSLEDLAKDGVRLVLAAGEVPAGRYALEFLTKASEDPAFGGDYKQAVLRNVISYEENVKAVLNKVALGEADAGIVYVTDLYGQAGGQVRAVAIPDPFNVEARYPIAPVADSRNPAAAQAFVDFVLSAEGQSILEEYDFIPAR